MKKTVFDLTTGVAQLIDVSSEELAELQAAAPPLATIEDRRAAALMSKPDFCRALYQAKILPEDSVVEAALGRWPAEFGAALAGLPAEARVDAKIAWAGAVSVNRMAPLFLNLLAFYAQAKGLTTAQAEALGDLIFGIAP